MPFEIIFVLIPCAVLTYGLKRFFDDRAQSRAHETALVADLRDLPKKISTFEVALKEAISQMFEFAKLTQRDRAEKAGAVARASHHGRP